MRKDWGLLVTAEHASRAVPDELANLGLVPAVFETHVAWDPGVKEVATWVAKHYEAPLLLGEWSRLVADLNRSGHTPPAVPEIAFGVPVPANHNLSDGLRHERVAKYHTPYWDKARDHVRRLLESHERVLHLSVHSFTPEYENEVRDVELGVMMDPERPLERRLADDWLVRLAEAGYDAKENEPYDGRADALVTGLRGEFEVERYAGMEIEINQCFLSHLRKVADTMIEILQPELSR